MVKALTKEVVVVVVDEVVLLVLVASGGCGGVAAGYGSVAAQVIVELRQRSQLTSL